MATGQGVVDSIAADVFNRRIRVRRNAHAYIKKEEAIEFADSYLIGRKDGMGWQLYEAVRVRQNWVDVYYVKSLSGLK